MSTFAVVFSPFLLSPSTLLQSIHRIFPFARGLFEDKVANIWCALNIVVKLRDLASVSTLAKLALVTTLLAILPGVIGLLWVSWEAGRRRREGELETKTIEEEPTESAPPTLILLPHSLFVSSMAFFLFSFQVHEKSILLPLMPLTILMGGREAKFGRMDWEWAVLLNNVGVFRLVSTFLVRARLLIFARQHVAAFQTRWSRTGIPRPHAFLELPHWLQPVLASHILCQVSIARQSRRSFSDGTHAEYQTFLLDLLQRDIRSPHPRARRIASRSSSRPLCRIQSHHQRRRLFARIPLGYKAIVAGGMVSRGDTVARSR